MTTELLKQASDLYDALIKEISNLPEVIAANFDAFSNQEIIFSCDDLKNKIILVTADILTGAAKGDIIYLNYFNTESDDDCISKVGENGKIIFISKEEKDIKLGQVYFELNVDIFTEADEKGRNEQRGSVILPIYVDPTEWRGILQYSIMKSV